MIDPYIEIQLFAQQALAAFLKMLNIIDDMNSIIDWWKHNNVLHWIAFRFALGNQWALLGIEKKGGKFKDVDIKKQSEKSQSVTITTAEAFYRVFRAKRVGPS